MNISKRQILLLLSLISTSAGSFGAGAAGDDDSLTQEAVEEVQDPQEEIARLTEELASEKKSHLQKALAYHLQIQQLVGELDAAKEHRDTVPKRVLVAILSFLAGVILAVPKAKQSKKKSSKASKSSSRKKRKRRKRRKPPRV